MLVTSILTISLLGVEVFGKTINVDVGKRGLLITPETITAAVGDRVQFAFYPTVSLVFAGFRHVDPSSVPSRHRLA
jgi:hypothetical protein